ncbi:hypothetical protein BROUX41_003047 [Berkeleyomyces rouxiae]|uniref:uncharacterized protein n=1 Tax=Berkeleyomyces rouxiae TaxID=2035830 RepID=UPI003B7A6A4E
MCFGSRNKSPDTKGPRPARIDSFQKGSSSTSVPPGVQAFSTKQQNAKASSRPQYQDYSSQEQHTQDFAPPPGPPPNHPPSASALAYDYGPPAAPPLSNRPEAWELAVPDTSLFPPPPAFFKGNDHSWTSNADEADGDAGHEWCEQNPLQTTIAAPEYVEKVSRTLNYAFRLPMHVSMPQNLKPKAPVSQLVNTATGVWRLKTTKTERDTSWMAMPPVYSAELAATSPQLVTTIYYEIAVNDPRVRGNSTVAIGYSALPYPDWRMPGWHRGSLAVHSDDGHRYVNDRWGGLDFTSPFKHGETVGLGMRFKRVPGTVTGPPRVTCFFTRNGKLDGTWDVNEEEDSEVNISRVGLQGHHDLCYAVGAYQDIDIDIILDPSKWRYDPNSLSL